MNPKEAAEPPAPAPHEPTGVRYLLSDLLKELEIERALGAHSMEKLDRKEIRKLVKEKGDRRVRSTK